VALAQEAVSDAPPAQEPSVTNKIPTRPPRSARSALLALSAALSAALSLGGCGQEEPELRELPQNPTYHADIAPLLARRCVACHQAGGLAPFSLEGYPQVAPMAQRVAAAVIARRMPPMPAAQDDDCPPIEDQRIMPDLEREAIKRWVEQGAVEGPPPAQAPATSTGRLLGEPSERYPMPAEYTPARTDADDYRCFPINPGWSSTVAVTAVSVEPGNRRIVHHASVYAVPPEAVAEIRRLDDAEAGPGYTCFGGVGVAQSYPLGVWVPGYDRPNEPPRPTIGYYLPAGWQLVLQNHYNFANGPGADRSTVTLWRAKVPITEIPHGMYLYDTTFVLPAGQKSTVRSVTGEVVPGWQIPQLGQTQEGFIYLSWAHMHLLGRSIRIDLLRRDGREQCVLRIPAWDFHWQSAYQLRKPVYAAAGDRIRLTCEWDNSFANQPVVDGMQQMPRDVTYGEKTTDEMCIGTLSLLNYPY
jgi:hypothetical protein